MFATLTLAAALAVSVPLPQAPPSPPPLTLAQAVARARTTSPLLVSVQNLLQGATNAARQSGRLLNPLLEVRVENLSSAGTTTLPLDVFAVIAQPFEVAGKRGLRLGVANAERDQAGASLQVVHRQVSQQTTQLYVHALKARGLLETLTANREGLATLVTTMRRRVDEGYAAESDLLKFETEAARLDIDVARAGLDLDRTLNALTYVIGGTAPVTAGQLVEPPPGAPPRLDAANMTAAIARHPEVLLATSRMERAQQVAALERAKRIPDPVLFAGYKRTAGIDTALAAVTMNLPLFERNGAAAAKATGEMLAAAADRDALAGRLAADAASLMATAEALADRYARAVRELLDPAEAVRNAARATFREGTTDVLQLIDAERVYGDARRTVLELRLEALNTSIEARFALGQEILP